MKCAMWLFCLCVGASLLTGCGANCHTIGASTHSTTVAVTDNPQVARYTYNAPSAGTVAVQFGTDTSYGRSTSAVTTSGGAVTILVAGMLAQTTYHMQAVFTGASGQMKDADQTFTTGCVPCKFTGVITTQMASGATPQPGIEVLDGINDGGIPAPVATDLAGNIIWTYMYPDQEEGVTAFPIRQLSNGDLLMLLAHNSSTLLTNSTGVDSVSELREINLAGDVVRSLTIGDLNSRLAAKGSALTLGGFSHEVLPLSNGHFIVDATTEESIVLSGKTSATTVLGDVIVDLDTNLQPVWLWNTFDHLDVNRQPFGFPDWTHANSLSYVPADGSLLYSLRHQNWVLKINYADGNGNGAIQWKLGPGGDFTLLNSDGSPDTAPEDWFYSQHAAEYLSTDAQNNMQIALMDNGDDRQFASGASCPVTAGNYCYTAIPIVQINPDKLTAQYVFRQVLDPSLYSSWGGNTTVLSNGNVHYDLAGLTGTNAAVFEVTNQQSPQTVWSMSITNGWIYRGERWPSLYPGVQW